MRIGIGLILLGAAFLLARIVFGDDRLLSLLNALALLSGFGLMGLHFFIQIRKTFEEGG